jgi:outer membrane immunogenic protein
MGPRGFAALLLLGILALPVQAEAADLISYGTSTNQQIPIAPTKSGYDWTGFYAGIFGADQNRANIGNLLGGGALAGANLSFDYFLVGGEVAVQGLANGTTSLAYGQALGRVGVLATQDALVFASVGAGMDLGLPNEKDLLVGGGLEYAVTDNVSLRAQYLHGFAFDGSADPKDQFTLGANYHF